LEAEDGVLEEVGGMGEKGEHIKNKIIEKTMTCGTHFTETQRVRWAFHRPNPTCQGFLTVEI
jgi:hypothetical protein